MVRNFIAFKRISEQGGIMPQELLCAFVASYAEAGGELPEDWELYDVNCGRLEWLEYNLRRALGVDCGADEREIGVGEVRATIAHAAYYHRMKSIILDCLLRYSQLKYREA